MTIGGFVLASALVFVVGPRMARVADRLGEATGMGGALFGAVFLALATDLPELAGDAEAIFEHVTGLSNDVGLLSEEYDTVRARLVGNLPQALSHVSLVNTARNLSQTGGPAEQREREAEPGAQRTVD